MTTLDRMRTPLLHETLREWRINSLPFSRMNCAAENPGGVPGGTPMKCARVPLAFATGSSWAERTRMSTPARWRAVDEHGFVLDIFLQRHRDTDAARIFLTRLLNEYDVPEVIHTDQLRSYGAAIRELSTLDHVHHRRVISTSRCNNIIEQRAGVVYGVRSARDNFIVLHGVRRDNSRDLGGGNEFKNF